MKKLITPLVFLSLGFLVKLQAEQRVPLVLQDLTERMMRVESTVQMRSRDSITGLRLSEAMQQRARLSWISNTFEDYTKAKEFNGKKIKVRDVPVIIAQFGPFLKKDERSSKFQASYLINWHMPPGEPLFDRITLNITEAEYNALHAFLKDSFVQRDVMVK